MFKRGDIGKHHHLASGFSLRERMPLTSLSLSLMYPPKLLSLPQKIVLKGSHGGRVSRTLEFDLSGTLTLVDNFHHVSHLNIGPSLFPSSLSVSSCLICFLLLVILPGALRLDDVVVLLQLPCVAGHGYAFSFHSQADGAFPVANRW